MKTFISRVVIASILSITLIVVTTTVPQISQKYLSYRSAKLTQAQTGADIPSSSYNEVLNTLFANSGR